MDCSAPQDNSESGPSSCGPQDLLPAPSYERLPSRRRFRRHPPSGGCQRMLRLSTSSTQEIHAKIHLVHRRYCVVHRLFYCVCGRDRDSMHESPSRLEVNLEADSEAAKILAADWLNAIRPQRKAYARRQRLAERTADRDGTNPGSRGTRPAASLAIFERTLCGDRRREGSPRSPDVGAATAGLELWTGPAGVRPPPPNKH